MEQKNPQLLSYNARLLEAGERVALARTQYKPKINIELSSRYHDQMEGNPTWQHTNDAMLVLRWNLFNGGSDKEAVNAAVSRKYESRSNLDEKLIELRELTASAWSTYISLQNQKKVYQYAVSASKEMFDTYQKQFNVSKRSLLDVLNAEKEYFQFARQLVVVSVNETIAAYRILGLGGSLGTSGFSQNVELSTDFSRLAQAIAFSPEVQPVFPESQAPFFISEKNADQALVMAQDHPTPARDLETVLIDKPETLYSIEIGPCITSRSLKRAKKILAELGADAQQTFGTGKVKVTRLLEGVYPAHAAFKRLKVIKKTAEAFVMPQHGKIAIYVGSFCTHASAIRYGKILAEKQIEVTPVRTEVNMQGNMLIVQHLDRQTAEMISGQMSKIGAAATVNLPDSK
ncbi:MAG: TolC family protein [Desulfobacterales bacterium]|nr:TolC family protein [Desulfobacterales bacterium]